MKQHKSIAKKILKKIREFYFDVSYSLLRQIPKTLKEAKGLRILVYHGICDVQPHLFNSRYLSVKQFDEQLQLMKSLYNPVSLNDINSGNLSDERLNVLITFDDGLKNNFTHALPLLKKHKIPAIFFVTGMASQPVHYLFNDIADVVPLLAGKEIHLNNKLFYNTTVYLNKRFVNEKHKQLAHLYHNASSTERISITSQLLNLVPQKELARHKLYFELMDAAELKEISDHPDYEIGAHGFYHTDLTLITETELREELKGITNYLKNILHKDTEALAFPYGSYNKEVINCCEQFNFSFLFGTEIQKEPTINGRLYERFTVNPFVSAINQMYYIAKNNYE